MQVRIPPNCVDSLKKAPRGTLLWVLEVRDRLATSITPRDPRALRECSLFIDGDLACLSRLGDFWQEGWECAAIVRTS